MDFQSLGLTDSILAAVTGQGYTTPTPIQARSIPQVLQGKDVLGIAQTGTGKTAAFAIPIIQRLMTIPAQAGPKRARALILSPTRELATQIAQSFRTYGDGSGISGTTIYGGVGQGGQVKALQRGIDVIVATPGRLLDLMSQGYVDLRGIEIFVLDEADRMLDMGFIKPIRDIIAQIPKTRQSLLFSATMPGEIQGLADSMLRNPVRIEVAPPRSTAATVTQSLAYVPRAQKVGTLIKLLDAPELVRVIVFTKTKHGADKVAKKLYDSGIDSEAIHGNRNQNQRQRALNAFKSGRVRVLVATDVAARGLDVDDITHVINMDLPMEPEAYVHRIGRTGRAGATGIAISFCDESERGLLRDIERMLGKKIPLARLGAHDDAEPMDHHAFDGDMPNRIQVSPGWHHDSPRQAGKTKGHAAKPSRHQPMDRESGHQIAHKTGHSSVPRVEHPHKGHRFQSHSGGELPSNPAMSDVKPRDSHHNQRPSTKTPDELIRRGGQPAKDDGREESSHGSRPSRGQHGQSVHGAGQPVRHTDASARSKPNSHPNPYPKRDASHPGHKDGFKGGHKASAPSGHQAGQSSGHKSASKSDQSAGPQLGPKSGPKFGPKSGSKHGGAGPAKGRFGPPRSR